MIGPKILPCGTPETTGRTSETDVEHGLYGQISMFQWLIGLLKGAGRVPQVHKYYCKCIVFGSMYS